MKPVTNVFYDKQITFANTISEYDSASGLYGKTTTQSKTVMCDVQPLNAIIDLDETGKLIDATFKVFCDIDSFITADCSVIYNQENYSITKFAVWDDPVIGYMIIYIKAVK